MTHHSPDDSPEAMLAHLMAVVRQHEAALAADDSPLAIVAREFFANNWAECCDGLLQRTRCFRVHPEWSAAPQSFRFELDRPYKRKLSRESPVELCEGPIGGLIRYRADLFVQPNLPYIAVQIDPDLAFFHPNCSRQRGSLLCLGELPDALFPFPLDLLLETRLYPILTYQDRRPSHPFDLEAARYFALDDEAMVGLEPVAPLY
jgi:hypothetical protein